MGKCRVFIFALTVLVAVPVGGVRGAALVRDIAEAAYGQVLEADLSISIGSSAVEVEGADVGPAELSSEISGPDINVVDRPLKLEH